MATAATAIISVALMLGRGLAFIFTNSTITLTLTLPLITILIFTLKTLCSVAAAKAYCESEECEMLPPITRTEQLKHSHRNHISQYTYFEEESAVRWGVIARHSLPSELHVIPTAITIAIAIAFAFAFAVTAFAVTAFAVTAFAVTAFAFATGVIIILANSPALSGTWQSKPFSEGKHGACIRAVQ
jgi:hypothetical protein